MMIGRRILSISQWMNRERPSLRTKSTTRTPSGKSARPTLSNQAPLIQGLGSEVSGMVSGFKCGQMEPDTKVSTLNVNGVSY